jgi:hypothetical protein
MQAWRWKHQRRRKKGCPRYRAIGTLCKNRLGVSATIRAWPSPPYHVMVVDRVLLAAQRGPWTRENPNKWGPWTRGNQSKQWALRLNNIKWGPLTRERHSASTQQHQMRPMDQRKPVPERPSRYPVADSRPSSQRPGRIHVSRMQL